MNVKINYPEHNTMGEKELIQNIAKAHAILIKESVERLDIDNKFKKKILEQILENLKKE